MKILADFGELKKAEQELLRCCQSGDIAVIGEERPTEKTEENEIRAEFVRWLILTDKVKITLMGIQTKGAWINGELNLDDVSCLYTLGFWKCIFKETLSLRRATIKMLYADGSWFEKGILADGLICNCNVHLRNGFQANGEVRFVGAKIAGSFDCTNATFTALDEKRPAFICNDISITRGLFLEQDCKIVKGYLDLGHASIGALSSDKVFWQQESLKTVYLNGFKYGHIYGRTSASFLLENMLGKMQEFKPQPYKQLAKVLRDMGHDRDADEVMIALRDKQLEKSKESRVYKYLRKFYKWTSAYGYRPIRTLKIMFWVWLGCGFFYWGAANVAVFAPTNPLIFQKKDYNCTIDTTGTSWGELLKDYNASNNWYEASPAEYTTFQPFWYSLDIILPVVDLKMENDWGIVIPSPEGSLGDMIPFTTTNHFIRFLTWVESLVGWGLSLMLVAILSGLAKNEKE